MFLLNELPLCPIETAAKIVGSKWRLMILRELMSQTKRYSEIQRGIPEISQKVLTENLKSMEKDGIIIRTAYAEVPPRVEYSLSDLGKDIIPVMKALAGWGIKYQESVKAANL